MGDPATLGPTPSSRDHVLHIMTLGLGCGELPLTQSPFCLLEPVLERIQCASEEGGGRGHIVWRIAGDCNSWM